MADSTQSKSGGLQAHLAALKKLQGKTLEVGWFATAKYPDGTSVAQVAAWNEFGTAKIPARPFLRLASVNIKSGIHKAVEKTALKMAEGKITAGQGMNQIGMWMEGKIVDSIKNGNWQSNSKVTIEGSANGFIKGKGFDKPLIDTGHMLQSVTSKVS